MRIRHNPIARPELEKTSFYVADPNGNRGKWRREFDRSDHPLFLELGCGKGAFLSQLSAREANCNFIGVDLKSEMLFLAKQKIEEQSHFKENDNVRIFCYDITRISEVFAPEDRVDGIYINFCNPWPKPKHQKRRLTHPRQLIQYREFMAEHAFLQFKTDDELLFYATREYLREEGFSLSFFSEDFSEEAFPDNIETEHEKMFLSQGKKIMGLIAKKR